MRRLSCALLLCLTTPLIAADRVDDKNPSDEQKQLLGKWIAASVNGKSLPPGEKMKDPLRDEEGLFDMPYVGRHIGQIVTISVTKRSPHAQSRITEHNRIVRTTILKKLDATKTPKEIDLLVYDFFEKARPFQIKQVEMKGIYKLKDGELTWCLALPGKPRPKEFAAPMGSGLTLVTLAAQTAGGVNDR